MGYYVFRNMGRRVLSFWELGRMKLIPSPLAPKCQGLNFLKNGGVGMAYARSRTCAKLCYKSERPGHRKKVKKKADKNWRPAKFRSLYVHGKRNDGSEDQQVQERGSGHGDVPIGERWSPCGFWQDRKRSNGEHDNRSDESSWLRSACKTQQ